MFQTTKGLVLRETEYKDHDKLLSVLTEDLGLVTARAWGVKRKDSALRSACQLLTFSEFTFRERQGFLSVQEAAPCEMFQPLRTDIDLLSLASYFAQAAEVLAQQDNPDPQLLRLVLHALSALCRGRPQEIVKASFEMRLAVLSGYEPELSQCPVCGRETPDRFQLSSGILHCAVCRDPSLDGLSLPVSEGTCHALRHITQCPLSKLFSFSLGEDSLRELTGLCESYLLTQLERGFYTLDFYKSLKLT